MINHTKTRHKKYNQLIISFTKIIGRVTKCTHSKSTNSISDSKKVQQRKISLTDTTDYTFPVNLWCLQ